MSVAVKVAYDGSIPLDNDRHELFCHEYIVDFNGQQAGERAGYAKGSARITVAKLLTNNNIQARLTYLKNQRVKRAQMTGDDVLKELECIAQSRIGNVVTWNESGTAFIKNSDEIGDDAHAAIESIEVKEDHYGNPEKGKGVMLTTKVKLHPKLPALKELAKHHGVCQADVNMTLNGESLPEGITINFVSSKGD